MRRRRHITLLAALGLVLSTDAQDPQLTQWFAAPLYQNAALTGTTFEDRIAMNYRLQWSGLPKGYETYAASYDHNSASAHSGFGAMILRDKSGSLDLAFTHVAVNYAYAARINRHSTFRAGLRLGYTIRDYDPSGVLFADQVIRDNAPTSIEPSMVESVSYPDVSAGGLYHTEQFWVGASFNHLNRPEQTLMIAGHARLPIRTSVTTGYKFAIDGEPYRKSKSFMTVAAHYKTQLKWDQLDLGVYIERERLTAGVWYRGLPALKAYQAGYPNDDAVALMVGFQTESQLRIIYSYDITISWLSLKSGGAHEISLQYEWPKRAKNRRYKTIPCPKF